VAQFVRAYCDSGERQSDLALGPGIVDSTAVLTPMGLPVRCSRVRDPAALRSRPGPGARRVLPKIASEDAGAAAITTSTGS
jgi:hypothetical protein